MAPSSPEDKERREMVSYIVRFSNILSECAPHALETSKFLYTTLFVREAKAKNKLPQILNEFEQKWEQRPLSLYQLIPHLLDFYGDSRNPDWRFARSHIVGFYDMCNKKSSQNITHSYNIKIPENFRPLPSLYYSVQNDIQYFRQNHEERKRAFRELQSELQAFKNSNPGQQCPVNRKYAILQSSAPQDTVWEVKKDAFAEIFQRTRELFLFNEEEAHFHHAARILDYWQSALERRNKPDTRRDEEAFEKQAKEMKTLQSVFVDILERIQRNLKMNEVVKFVSIRMDMSRDFVSIRNTVAKRFDKMKHLLDDSDYVLPALVKQEASLASSLYAALHERQKLHDEIKRTSEKLKNLLQQARGWENLTGTKLFSEPPALGHASNNPPVGRPQTVHSQPTQPVATQEQSREPHVIPSPIQTINNDGTRQPETAQSQARSLQSSETHGDARQSTEPQAIQPQIGSQPSNEQQLQTRVNETIQHHETPRIPPPGLSQLPLWTEGSQDSLDGIFQLELFPGELLPGELQVGEPQVGEHQVGEHQVEEHQVGEHQVCDPQSSAEQAAASQLSLPQEREQIIWREQESQPAVEAFTAQTFGPDQGDQGQGDQLQNSQQLVGNPSEQAPEENQNSQQQHVASPGEEPDASQDSEQQELDFDGLTPQPNSGEALLPSSPLPTNRDFMAELNQLLDLDDDDQPGL